MPHPHLYSPAAPFHSLAQAITSVRPALIIPADDPATKQLHELHSREVGKPIRGVIERSLGSSESFPILEKRAAIMRVAEEIGVPVPKTEVIATTACLEKWLTRFSFPVVLKADGTSGGTGVRIASTHEEAKRTFHELQFRPNSSQSLLQRWMRHGESLFWPSFHTQCTVVNAQVHVAGKDAVSEVACWQGKILASLHFQVLRKQYESGPSSVLRLIENPQMFLATEKIVRRLGLSGLHGFDFILEEETGNAYLTEMNPRATQVGHLTFGPGRDLPAALYAAVSGEDPRIAPKVIDNATVALFPQEWIRNRASVFLKSAYHDVPWEEPELVRACVQSHPEPQVRSARPEEWIRELATARIPEP